MKKLFTIAFILTLPLILVGCGNTDTPTKQPTPIVVETPTEEITATDTESEIEMTKEETTATTEAVETTEPTVEESNTESLPANQTLTLDVKNSRIKWTGVKLTGDGNTGFIGAKSGNLTMTDGKITGGKFVINMKNMTVTNITGGSAEKLIKHLQSDDYFAVANHPTATFEITTAQVVADGYNVAGNMTIKGITHPLAFSASMADNKAKADIVLDRNLWNIGGSMLKDQITIGLDLAFTQ